MHNHEKHDSNRHGGRKKGGYPNYEPEVRTRHSFLQSSYNVAADTVVQATGNCFMWTEWVRKNWITIAVIADCYHNPVLRTHSVHMKQFLVA